ncbi:unnamed protein product, partial [marine sediment metagenome]
PLVLTTTSDGNGNWSYTIEDPLEPGSHEAYVAVESDNGEFVRSQSFAFTINQAASTEDNPSGLSLALGSSSNDAVSSYLGFIVLAIGLIVAAFVTFILIVRHKTKVMHDNRDIQADGLPRTP